MNADGVPDLIIPDNPRTRLPAVTVAGGKFRDLGRIDPGTEPATQLYLAPNGKKGRKGLSFGLTNRRIMGIRFGRRM